MRSLSLTRSSAAPRTRDLRRRAPPARRSPAARRSGPALRRARSRPSRSRSPFDRRSCRAARRRRSRSTSTSTRAPKRRSTSSSPVRVGFSPTSSISTRDPGSAAAATSQNAADEKSPGTGERPAVQALAAGDRHRQPVDADRARRTPPAPARCGRGSAAGSATLVVPSACSPARSTALLTCALGTSGRWAMACSARAVNRQRGVAVGGLDARAHLLERLDDAAHRPARQRRVADHAWLENGWPASTPASSRIVVPELPASSGPAGERSRPKPRPSKVTVPSGLSSISTPSAAQAGRASTGSRRPGQNWSASTRPSASAASRA